MAISVTDDLRRCDGFRVECPDRPIGWVEEVWLDPSDEPRALAVRTLDGRRALLPADEVAAVLPEERWVVVSAEPALLELAAPRLEPTDGRGDSRLVASWATTGAALPPPPAPGLFRRGALGFSLRRPPRALIGEPDAERPVWQTVALLYSALALLVALVMSAAFIVSYFVTGHAY